MRKLLGLVLTTGALLGSLPLDVAARELGTVEKEIQEQWDKHKSITAKLKTVTRMDMGDEVNEGECRGTYQVVKKGGKTLFRQYYERRVVTKVGDRREIADEKNMMIMDGEFLYKLIEIMGRKAASKQKPGPQDYPGPKSRLGILRKDYGLKLLPPESVDGSGVYMIEGRRKKESTSPISRTILYYRRDGVLMKVVNYVGEKPVQTTTFSDIELDVKVEPCLFVFKPPQGVQVRDLTHGPTQK